VHETTFILGENATATVVSGSSDHIRQSTLNDSALVLQYQTEGQTVVELGNGALVYILGGQIASLRNECTHWTIGRTEAYKFWVLYLPEDDSPSGLGPQYSHSNPMIVKGGYLLRSVSDDGGVLSLVGDLNATTDFEIIAPSSFTGVSFNGDELETKDTGYGTLTASRVVQLPTVDLPDLESLVWVSK
jgi:hypothetical protein